MIIPVKKYLFMGKKQDLADFFIRSQEEGCIEFITEKGRKGKDVPEPIRKLASAIKILRKQPVKEPYRKGGDLAYADEIATQVLDLVHEIEKLSEEQRFLEAEITRVGPFGKFSFEDIAFIEERTGKKIQFFCVKSTKRHEIEEAPSLIYVGTDYDLDYFIGIHDEPVTYPDMIEMHFDRTVDQLKNHLAFVVETLHQVEAELKGYARYIDFLRDSLLAQLDIHSLEKVQREVSHPLGSSLFSIEGWVPENKIEKLSRIIGDKSIIFEPIAIEAVEKIPTYMENKGVNLIGEDLVRIYDIPSSNDKDPSGWVLWAFAFFFAMILSDGGYGLLYLGLASFLSYKFPDLKAAHKRLLKLVFILSSISVAWGILTTSFFGVQFSPENKLTNVSFIKYLAIKKADYHRQHKDEVYKYWVEKHPAVAQAKTGEEMLYKATVKKNKQTVYEMFDEFSDNILLEFSLLIGVIHVSLSLLRYAKRHLANLGWVAFAIGGYLYFPVSLHATSLIEFLGWIPRTTANTVGLQLLYGGIALAVILAFIQKRLKGLAEITQVIQVFADILSYLRLYALALASTIMARTFNEMGLNVGLVIGSVIILVGHTVNLLLGTMGGVIHGLRLNFIEWYHYSFEGEGRLFNPLRKLRLKTGVK